MRQKKLLSVLLAGAMVVSGGSISGLEGDYTGSCSGSIFYRMERAAGGIPGEPRGGKSDFLQL